MMQMQHDTVEKDRKSGIIMKSTEHIHMPEVPPAAMRAVSMLRKDIVLCVSLVLAAVSSFFVRPDAQYAGYIDFETLSLLLSLMIVMAGFQKTGLFRMIGEKLISKARTVRRTAAVLVFLCFFISMIITNDVALLTFVPFAIAVCSMAGMERHIISIITMQTIAANLGSMVTPVGNPQNLYIYAKSGMGLADFLRITGPMAAAAFLLLLLYIAVLPGGKQVCISSDAEKKAAETTRQKSMPKLNPKKILLYTVLFTVCLSTVMHLTDYRIMLLTVLAAVLAAEPSVLKNVDYGLLLTFIGFFIFIGNIGRIPVFCEIFGNLTDTLGAAAGILVSQVISNVPAALLLSGFTQRWDQLLVGVSLGGLGTLIASMASLISYKLLTKEYPGKKADYIKYFTAANIGFLAVLTGISAAVI